MLTNHPEISAPEAWRLVLYVEDNPSTALLFRTVLSELACNVRLVVVEDAVAAFSFLAQEKALPDLVVLDLNLPGKDGLTVLEEIRHTPRLAQLAVVIFSTSMLSRDQERARSLGAVDFVQKPLRLEAFQQAVKRLCSKAASAAGG